MANQSETIHQGFGLVIQDLGFGVAGVEFLDSQQRLAQHVLIHLLEHLILRLDLLDDHFMARLSLFTLGFQR